MKAEGSIMEAVDQPRTMKGEAIEGVEEQEVEEEKIQNSVGVAEAIIEVGASVEAGSKIIKMRVAKVPSTKSFPGRAEEAINNNINPDSQTRDSKTTSKIKTRTHSTETISMCRPPTTRIDSNYF